MFFLTTDSQISIGQKPVVKAEFFLENKPVSVYLSMWLPPSTLEVMILAHREQDVERYYRGVCAVGQKV